MPFMPLHTSTKKLPSTPALCVLKACQTVFTSHRRRHVDAKLRTRKIRAAFSTIVQIVKKRPHLLRDVAALVHIYYQEIGPLLATPPRITSHQINTLAMQILEYISRLFPNWLATRDSPANTRPPDTHFTAFATECIYRLSRGFIMDNIVIFPKVHTCNHCDSDAPHSGRQGYPSLRCILIPLFRRFHGLQHTHRQQKTATGSN
jgi:hypothetical protein